MKFWRDVVNSDKNQTKHNLEIYKKHIKIAKAKRKQERKNRKAGRK